MCVCVDNAEIPVWNCRSLNSHLPDRTVFLSTQETTTAGETALVSSSSLHVHHVYMKNISFYVHHFVYYHFLISLQLDRVGLLEPAVYSTVPQTCIIMDRINTDSVAPCYSLKTSEEGWGWVGGCCSAFLSEGLSWKSNCLCF